MVTMSDSETENEEVIVIESCNVPSGRESRFKKRQQKAISLVQDEDSCDTALREGGIDTSGMSKNEKQQLLKILQMSKADTSHVDDREFSELKSPEADGESRYTETYDESSSTQHKDVAKVTLSKPAPLEEIDYGEWISAQTRMAPENPMRKEEENKPKMLVKPVVKKVGRQVPKRTAPPQNLKSKGEHDERPLKQRKIEQFSHIIIPEEATSLESQDCKQMDFDDKQHSPNNSGGDDDDTQPPNSPDIFQSQHLKDEDKQGGDICQKEVYEEATQDYDVTEQDNKENVTADDEVKESIKTGKQNGQQRKKNFLNFSKFKSIKDSMIRAVRSKFSQSHEEENKISEEENLDEVETYEEVKPLYRHYRKVKKKYKTRQTYYAPAGIDTKDYAKVILQLFEIYHRKLAEAQARVDTFINWGEGVKVGRHMSDSIGVWRKRNPYLDDYSEDEADFMMVKPSTAVDKKTVSDDEDNMKTTVAPRRLRGRETSSNSVKKKDTFDFETQPFCQDDIHMEIDNDDTTSRHSSENNPSTSEQNKQDLDQQVTYTTDQGSNHIAQKGGKTATRAGEGQKKKKLYSESFEKFIPVDNSLHDRRWSDIMDENSNDEFLSLQNVKVNYSRKQRPIRLAKKREKILTKTLKKSTLDKHGSDSSIELIPSDKEGCDEISELTRNQRPNFSNNLQDQSDAQRKLSQSPGNSSRSTDYTVTGSCAGSPVNRPSSGTSDVSKESLSQGSGYMLNPQGEIYSTQACVRREKMQISMEKKNKKSRLKKRNETLAHGKEHSEKSLRILRNKSVTDVVTELKDSEGESSGKRTTSSGVPSEENESSRESTDITFSLMQPTLVDDNIECFETKSQHRHSTACQKDSPHREASSNTPDKTDSQSPDFKKSKIIKKQLKIVASDSEDEKVLTLKAEHAQPEVVLSKHSPARVKPVPVDSEEVSSNKQYLMPGPSWFQPREKNRQSLALESGHQDDANDSRAKTSTKFENVDENKDMKDNQILRKSPRHRTAEKEVERGSGRLRGKNRGSRNMTARGGRGKGQIRKLRENQGKNLQNTSSDEEERGRGQTRNLRENRRKIPQNTGSVEEEVGRGQTHNLEENRRKNSQNTSSDEEERGRGQTHYLKENRIKNPRNTSTNSDEAVSATYHAFQPDCEDVVKREALLTDKNVDSISTKYDRRMRCGYKVDDESNRQETNVLGQNDDGSGDKQQQGKKRSETTHGDGSSVIDLGSSGSGEENQTFEPPGRENRQRTRGRKGKVIQQTGNGEGTVGQAKDIETETVHRSHRKRMLEKDEDLELGHKSQKVEKMPCPLCNMEFPMDQIQEHAAECEGEIPDDDEAAAIHPSDEHDIEDLGRQSEVLHSSQPHSQSLHGDSTGPQKSSDPYSVEMETCYVCDEEFPKGKEYNKHIDECLEEAKKRQQEADRKKYRIPRQHEESRTTRSKVKDEKKLFEGLEERWAEAQSDGYSSENDEEDSQTLKDIIQNGHSRTEAKLLDSSQSSSESDFFYGSNEHSQSNNFLPGGWTLEELANSPIKTYVPISAQSESEGFKNQYSQAKARYERQLLRQSNASGKLKKKGRKRKRRSAKGKKKTANKKRKT